MTIKKYDLEVGCQECIYKNSYGDKDFDLTVPVTYRPSGIMGTATIRCVIRMGYHQLELKGWYDENNQQIQVTGEVLSRVSSLLDFISENKLCGNRQICPAEIVEIVEKADKI